MDSFRCKASACEDTCCAGWEIDVDGDTADYYDSLDGDDGAFVRAKLYRGDDGYQLCHEGARCRFLREDNLCELILRLGEDALCDICREHPRFYSGVGDLTEAGLGLCCEEAARLWLEMPIAFDRIDDGRSCDDLAEAELDAQMRAIEHLTHGDGTLGERFSELLGDGGGDCYPELRRLYASLEMMDADFGERYSQDTPIAADVRFANLAAYFVYRYWFELGATTALKFAAVSLIMIAALGGELQRAAKAYSGEVEYDPDNMERICEFLDTIELSWLVKKVLVC